MSPDDSNASTAMPSASVALSVTASDLQLHPIVDLPPDYAAAIGQIAAKWNWLEWQLGVLIREGFDLDKKEGRVLVGTSKLSLKVTILKIMALKWIPEVKFRDELRRFASDCYKQTDNRNDHVHGLWVHPVGEPNNIGLQIMDSGEQRHKPEFRPVPLADLNELIAAFKSLQDRAQRLTDQMKGRIPRDA